MHRKGEQPNIHIQYQCFNERLYQGRIYALKLKKVPVLDNGFLLENIFFTGL